jgi:hypothetical protein
LACMLLRAPSDSRNLASASARAELSLSSSERSLSWWSATVSFHKYCLSSVLISTDNNSFIAQLTVSNVFIFKYQSNRPTHCNDQKIFTMSHGSSISRTLSTCQGKDLSQYLSACNPKLYQLRYPTHLLLHRN